MRNIDFEREISIVARRQHGAFHTRQAREVGGTAAVLRNRLSNGAVLQLAPKVWAVAGHPATWKRQYKAAELSVPDSALADRGASLVHGLEGSRVVRPTVVVDYEANRRQRLTDVRRASEVAITTVDGFRVTSVAQTLFDLLACDGLSAVERAMDGALVTGAVTMAELEERLEVSERLGRRNTSPFRTLLNERSADLPDTAESELELVLHRILRKLGTDVEVVYQATPPWWHTTRSRVDAYIPAWRLVVEADGRRWHSRLADFDRDRWRDNLATANGHRVLRFTHTHLTERPKEALELLRAVGRSSATEANAA